MNKTEWIQDFITKHNSNSADNLRQLAEQEYEKAIQDAGYVNSAEMEFWQSMQEQREREFQQEIDTTKALANSYDPNLLPTQPVDKMDKLIGLIEKLVTQRVPVRESYGLTESKQVDTDALDTGPIDNDFGIENIAEVGDDISRSIAATIAYSLYDEDINRIVDREILDTYDIPDLDLGEFEELQKDIRKVLHAYLDNWISDVLRRNFFDSKPVLQNESTVISSVDFLKLLKG